MLRVYFVLVLVFAGRMTGAQERVGELEAQVAELEKEKRTLQEDIAVRARTARVC